MARDYLKFVINKLKSSNQCKPEEIECIEKIFEKFNNLLHQEYPNFDFFTIATGKDYGDAIEKKIIESFGQGLTKSEDSSYDAIITSAGSYKDKKVEIKSIRAVKKPAEDKFLVERIMIDTDTKGFSTSSFQQSKPSCCDYFIFHILYGNSERLFIVPSSMVSSRPGKQYAETGKIPLSVQHRNHTTEGQINLGQILKYAKIFEITTQTYTYRNQYNIDDFIQEVETKLASIGNDLSNI